jgi:hypothetical protein
MPNKIVVNSDELSQYLYQFLLHAKIGDSYHLVIKQGSLYIKGHIYTTGRVKVRPPSADYMQPWPYQRYARLAVILSAVEPQDIVFNLDTFSICVIL